MTSRTLVIENVSLSVSGHDLIRDLSFTVNADHPTTIMGPSGVGKSALLAFVGGHLDRAFIAEGRVFLDGVNITRLPAEHRRVGMLFQDDLLFPHLSVGANMAFGLNSQIRGRIERRSAIEQALVEIGLAGFHDRSPATLSGGQRARVALMRSLLANPRALLLDEPFSKLDHDMRRDFRRLVFDSAANRRLPVLVATHDPADAEGAGGGVVHLGKTLSTMETLR